MLIGFIGDIHGRVYHTIGAIATWQAKTGKRFDLLIQVGDLGAFPDLTKLDPDTNRHLAADPAEADFSRFIVAQGPQAEALRAMRQQFLSPIYFNRGNHEDFAWLDHIQSQANTATIPIDPYDLFHFVSDSTVLEFGDTRIAFLGGVEEQDDEAAIDQTAYQSLLALGTGQIDVLVTHEGPYGSSIGFHGDTHGSPLISELIAKTEPSFQIAGHAHTVSGPKMYGNTLYLGLTIIVAPPLWYPDATGLQSGWMAVLDTNTANLQLVNDAWLAAFPKPFDFDLWFRENYE